MKLLESSGRFEQARRVERVGDGAGAVVAAVLEMKERWPPPYLYGSVWIVLAAQTACCTCGGASAGAAAVPSGSRTACVPGTSGWGCPSGTVLGSGGGGGGGA